jgi:hypothetical protein
MNDTQNSDPNATIASVRILDVNHVDIVNRSSVES